MDDPKKQSKQKVGIKKTSTAKKKISYKWIVTVILWSSFLSASLSLSSSTVMDNVNLTVAIIIVIVIISIGVVFDILGVSVTTANEMPFHSLASRKVSGAKQSIMLIRHAEKVGSFCNDVVGDIAGIISGSASAAIVLLLLKHLDFLNDITITVIITSLISAITIGGKAIGKYIAFANANSIVFLAGKLIFFFDSVFRRSNK